MRLVDRKPLFYHYNLLPALHYNQVVDNHLDLVGQYIHIGFYFSWGKWKLTSYFTTTPLFFKAWNQFILLQKSCCLPEVMRFWSLSSGISTCDISFVYSGLISEHCDRSQLYSLFLACHCAIMDRVNLYKWKDPSIDQRERSMKSNWMWIPRRRNNILTEVTTHFDIITER